jgi:hypothetical protein
MQEIRLAC